MNEEIRVSIEPDQGIKKQWARGLFYRNDGKKKTFISENLFAVCVGGFVLMGIGLLLQGSSEESKPVINSAWAIPSTVQGEKVENVPSVVTNATAASSSRDPRPKSSTRNSRQVKFTGPQLVSRPNLGKIPPGSIVKATLLTGGSNGSIRAQVTEPLSLNGETLIEEGTILLGAGQSSEDRLQIRFSQMVFKDGAFSSIDAQGCDGEDKIAGIKGSRVGNQALRLATGIGLNFAGGISGALVDTEGQNGAVIQRPTLKNALLVGAGTAAIDQSREMMSETRNKPPVIEVPAGTTIYVLFQGS
ncbi:MAG: TrbI/VirB10 family protein [Bdellovibrio sp.]|nr:TrbI/VirB10 family protein [Bdellovibrio sp.]